MQYDQVSCGSQDNFRSEINLFFLLNLIEIFCIYLFIETCFALDGDILKCFINFYLKYFSNIFILQIVHSSHPCGAGGIGYEPGFAPGIQKQPDLGHGQTRQSPQTGGGAQVEDRQAAGGH